MTSTNTGPGPKAGTDMSVRKQITVGAGQRVAFEVFTGAMGSWWKPGHHIGEQPFADVVIEPHEDGRWFERDAEGHECQWGKVLTWSPYDLVVLTWQLTEEWAFDPDFSTEVEVRFVSAGPSSTRVELEHRGFERFGTVAAEVLATFDSPNGWTGLLELYAGRVG